jgi:uncharacterized protein (TIGR03000 family)
MQKAWLRTTLCVLAISGSAILGLHAQDAGARIIVKVPADAVISIDGNPTRTTGARRLFETPNLTRGQKFKYELRATWTENGRPQTATRTVEVEAGKEVEVDLTPPPAERLAPPAGLGTPTAPPASPPRPAPGAKTREFNFTYKATVTGLQPGKLARIWLPVPQTTEDQIATLTKQEAPAQGIITREPKYGNQLYYVEAKAGNDGSIPLSLTFRVNRFEVKADASSKPTPQEVEAFLRPDAMVPSGGKSLALLTGKALPNDQFETGRAIYDIVNDHMTYSKDKGPGWGRGDSDWACDSRFGNCTDFHSLFISLVRAQKMPAKFEMGFSVPEKRGTGEIAGYHCWCKFKPQGRGWIPVDISEANKVKTSKPEMVKYYFGNLTEDRVTFSTGRDLMLVPPQAGTPLNFFIYPYVEVDGQTYSGDKIKRAFSYEDVASK